MNRKLAASAIAAIVVGGGVAASVSIANAQTGTTGSSATAQSPDQPTRQARLKTTLDPLVKDGTIDQSQEDKVIAALNSAKPNGAAGLGRHGGFGLGAPGADTAVVAKALGVTTDQLKTDLQGGKSIADIATAQHVDLSKVIQTLVDDQNTKLDAAVKAGTLTQAQADTIKANETQRITDRVNGKFPVGGFRGHRGGGWRTGTPTGDAGGASNNAASNGSA